MEWDANVPRVDDWDDLQAKLGSGLALARRLTRIVTGRAPDFAEAHRLLALSWSALLHRRDLPFLEQILCDLESGLIRPGCTMSEAREHFTRRAQVDVGARFALSSLIGDAEEKARVAAECAAAGCGQALYEVGCKFLCERAYLKAVPYLRAAAAKGVVRALERIGGCLLVLKDFRGAREDLKAVVNGGRIWACASLALAEAELGHDREAIRQLRRARSAEADWSAVFSAWSMIHVPGAERQRFLAARHGFAGGLGGEAVAKGCVVLQLTGTGCAMDVREARATWLRALASLI
jgi:hypothetical protein